MAPPGPKKKRKANFVAAEMEIMLEALTRHTAVLYGAERQNTTVAQRRAIFEAITLDINALGFEDRTWMDIQKKFTDMRRRVRDKIVLIKKHSRGTGGGPACSVRLNPEEEVISQSLALEQVEGLPGYDSTVGDLGTDVDDEAGPSSAVGRPTPSPEHHGVQSGPLQILGMLVEEDIGQSPSREEEVVEEAVILNLEEAVSLQEDPTIPDRPTTPPTITSSPSRASPSSVPPSSVPPSSVPPSSVTPSCVTPSPSAPSVRAPASPPRKALSKTRGVPSSLREGLQEEQARQTHHIGEMVGDLRRVADSLASSSSSVQQALTHHADRGDRQNETLEDVSGNCAAIVTCLVEQQDATALLTSEVSRLAGAVEANTAAVREEGRLTRRQLRITTTWQMRMLGQTNTVLNRLANAMEGLQAPPARRDEVGVDAPPPPSPPHAPPRHLRSQSRGTLGPRMSKRKK